MPKDRIKLIEEQDGIKRTILEDKIRKEIVVNEALIFDVEEGDFAEDVVDGIGGAVVKTKEKTEDEKE